MHISEFNPRPGVENPDRDLSERFQARWAGNTPIAAKGAPTIPPASTRETGHSEEVAKGPQVPWQRKDVTK